jgi:hypothetical protein
MGGRDLFGAAAGALAAVALAGGVARAASPTAGEVINGCYQGVEGQLRVVDSTAAGCRPPEVAIAWNAQGVKGEKGKPGAPGRDGREGRDGAGVTVTPEPAGANCAAGGVKLTAANGVAYVCNAGQTVPPDPGPD